MRHKQKNTGSLLDIPANMTTLESVCSRKKKQNSNFSHICKIEIDMEIRFGFMNTKEHYEILWKERKKKKKIYKKLNQIRYMKKEEFHGRPA